MSGVYLFLTEDFEEIEALGTLNVLRRGGVEVKTVSLTDGLLVKGSHDIVVQADLLFEELEEADCRMLILPGGPGTAGYHRHEGLLTLLKRHCGQDRYMAAICAAPSVLGRLGLLAGRRAVCYPGYEKELAGAVIGEGAVEVDGSFITSRGPGTALAFGLALLEILAGREKAEEVSGKMLLT